MRDYGDLHRQVLAIVTRGISKPADITREAQRDKHAVRRVLFALVDDGQLRAEGSTVARRYYLADSRRAAKEDLR